MIGQAQATVSAVLITYNDAGHMRPCLDSIGWVDEIVIMDLGSTDSTVAVCREYTDRVHTHEWVPYAELIRNEAIALAKGKWVLMLDVLDGDEPLSPGLVSQLQAVMARDEEDVVLTPFWFMTIGFTSSTGSPCGPACGSCEGGPLPAIGAFTAGSGG